MFSKESSTDKFRISKPLSFWLLTQLHKPSVSGFLLYGTKEVISSLYGSHLGSVAHSKCLGEKLVYNSI